MKAKLKEVIEFYSLKENDKTAAVAAGITLAQMFCCISIKKNCPENTFSSNSFAAVSKAASIIEANLHLPLSISAVAKKAGLSQNYLARLFKEHYKMTLSGYQTRKRMEFAGYLLLNSNLKIKEIGVRCGIPDAQHFNKLFRKFTGKSPSAARCGVKAGEFDNYHERSL
jgi:transcriptional regulator GlxA family with amidase domain